MLFFVDNIERLFYFQQDIVVKWCKDKKIWSETLNTTLNFWTWMVFCRRLLSPSTHVFILHIVVRLLNRQNTQFWVVSVSSTSKAYTSSYTFIGFNTDWLYKLKHTYIYILTLKQVKYYDANYNHQQSTFLPIWPNFAGELMKDCAPTVHLLQQDLDLDPKIELLTCFHLLSQQSIA